MFRISILIFFFTSFNLLSQSDIDSIEIYKFLIEDGDTFISSTIKNVVISDYENENDKRQYRKIKYRIKKVYPYYLMTVETYKNVNESIITFT